MCGTQSWYYRFRPSKTEIGHGCKKGKARQEWREGKEYVHALSAVSLACPISPCVCIDWALSFFGEREGGTDLVRD